MHKVALLLGEGIGREVVPEAVRVVDATGVKVRWDECLIGEDAVRQYSVPIPRATIHTILDNRVALKGPTGTPPGSSDLSYNVQLRKLLNLYANVRPFRTVPGIKTRWSDTKVDLVVFRENTEDLYAGIENRTAEGAEAQAVFTTAGCERIAKYAFQYATSHNRKKMTIVHKANILKVTHGLFRDIAYDVSKQYPSIACEDKIADNFQMQLVTNPNRFDCILLPNFLGDLASDLCAALVGGLGFAPGVNIGKNCAVFEAVHGTAPDIAGKGIANPTSIILSSAMMLDHLGEHESAYRIRRAVNSVLLEGKFVTGDINPVNPVSTSQFTDIVITRL